MKETAVRMEPELEFLICHNKSPSNEGFETNQVHILHLISSVRFYSRDTKTTSIEYFGISVQVFIL